VRELFPSNFLLCCRHRSKRELIEKSYASFLTALTLDGMMSDERLARISVVQREAGITKSQHDKVSCMNNS
jgi:hypothetical protein